MVIEKPIPKQPLRLSDNLQTVSRRNYFVIIPILIIISAILVFLSWILFVGVLVISLVLYILFRFVKKRLPPKKGQSPINKMGLVKSIKENLRPFKDELVSEWRWFLKYLHIYDHEKEEKYLLDYRKLRGWD